MCDVFIIKLVVFFDEKLIVWCFVIGELFKLIIWFWYMIGYEIKYYLEVFRYFLNVILVVKLFVNLFVVCDREVIIWCIRENW